MNEKQSLSLAIPELLSFFDGDEIIQTNAEQGLEKEDVPVQAIIENHAPLVFEGNNSNGLLLLFAHPGDNRIPDSDQSLLERLVENPAALNKKLSECAILNLKHSAADWPTLLAELKPKKVICWDIIPAGMQLTEKYKTEIHQGVKVILSDSIAKLEAEPKLKVPLWNELKQHFL